MFSPPPTFKPADADIEAIGNLLPDDTQIDIRVGLKVWHALYWREVELWERLPRKDDISRGLKRIENAVVKLWRELKAADKAAIAPGISGDREPLAAAEFERIYDQLTLRDTLAVTPSVSEDGIPTFSVAEDLARMQEAIDFLRSNWDGRSRRKPDYPGLFETVRSIKDAWERANGGGRFAPHFSDPIPDIDEPPKPLNSASQVTCAVMQLIDPQLTNAAVQTAMTKVRDADREISDKK